MSAALLTITGNPITLSGLPNSLPAEELAERSFTLPKPTGGAPYIWLAADGGIGVEIWMLVKPGYWTRVEAFAIITNVMKALLPASYVADTPLFVRVTSVTGATALYVGVNY
jgi:hypothetical protein